MLEISKSLPPIRYVYALRTETRYKCVFTGSAGTGKSYLLKCRNVETYNPILLLKQSLSPTCHLLFCHCFLLSENWEHNWEWSCTGVIHIKMAQDLGVFQEVPGRTSLTSPLKFHMWSIQKLRKGNWILIFVISIIQV